ncbi:MAG: prolipoprotein diacylglyceryl transferase [Flavobacteriaceae bacterium]|jgi:prolipoprotein diacylglyceryl transferase|nr:prolipoprotein diacylglyceryl transferase [Flavobacteriaceae bacterium]MDG1965090.1 prolipoprotein diacylglyceryl transferase [Flavobacteriaceae bacterium]
MTFLKINWAPNEKLFEIGGFGIHIYSLMFIIAFLLGLRLYKKMFIKENVDQKYLEPLFIYMVVSTLLGARLGEVFFYNWDYFQNHLLEILLPIKEKADGSGYRFIGFRGLASHGATIGILIGIYLYQRIYKFKPLIWILDRLTIPVAIGGFFVRTGNFFNSEIVGKYTGSNFGVVFQNRGEIHPRYPAQMYEAFGYLILFFVLRKIYTSRFRDQGGFLLGIFFIGLFSIRFLVEYVKESQGGFEEIMPLLSTGQWLSIPFIALGTILLILSFRKKITQTP